MPDVCRFCLSEDNDKSNPFLSPCNCIGSVQFVHRGCLNHWRIVTPDRDQKIRCQLCHSLYNLPRRWLEESIPISGALWNNFLSQSFIVIMLTHYLHLLCVTHFSEFRIKSQDPHQAAYILHDKLSLTSYYILLALISFIYSIYYTTLYNRIINRSLYFYLGAFEITQFLAGAGLCLYLAQYTLFPCGGIYIYLLSHYRKIHVNILHKINEDGAY